MSNLYRSLLTKLNHKASSPYTIQTEQYTSIHPIKIKETKIKVSNLTFMDDSTLISTSKEGLETLLSITEEFYTINNTSANHSKYVLISNELHKTQDITFNLTQSKLNTYPNIIIKSKPSNHFFRFLDVWLNVNNDRKYVINQLHAEYNN